MATSTRDRLRQIVPLVGTVLLFGLILRTTDLAKFSAALRTADLLRYGLTVSITSVIVWLYDTACVTWLIGQTLRDRGRALPWKTLLPVKAASYAINAINYHAATLAMAWLVGKRKQVSFLEATGALALLSYLDLVAVAGMVAAGLMLAPDVVAAQPGLQAWLQGVTVAIFVGAVASVLLLQSGWKLPLLVKLRALPVLRPLAALSPGAMVVGIVLRTGLVMAYAAINMQLMACFGMQPTWGRMLVVLPILTVVGTVPISVSGIGTTQVLMRVLYAPFVADGRDAAPVIDAFSTAMIVGFVGVRLVVALPFLRGILAELREQKTS